MWVSRLGIGAFAVAWVASAALACGSGDGSSGGGPPPPIDRGAQISAIGSTDYGELCDWASAELGGYGHTVSCPNGTTVGAYSSHEACVSQPIPSSCTATVGEYEDCVTAIAASPSLCTFISDPPAACQPLFATCASAFGA